MYSEGGSTLRLYMSAMKRTYQYMRTSVVGYQYYKATVRKAILCAAEEVTLETANRGEKS